LGNEAIQSGEMTKDQRLPIWFAITAFVLGNCFVFVNPPLRAPDEWAHFSRAWQISRFHPCPQEQNGILGGYVPAGIDELNSRFANVPYNGASVAKLIDSRRISLNESDQKFLYFPSIAEYPPVPFVPQAVGIDVARMFSRSALAAMYCGREANLIGYILMVWLALTWMPHPQHRLTLALVALLPMSLHQAGSLSADGMTIGLAIVVTTVIWRLTFLESEVSRTELILLFVSTISLSLTKLTYAPISLLILMIPAKRLGGSRRYAAIVASVLLCSCIAIILWMSQFRGVPKLDLNPAVNPAQQKEYILHHPDRVVPILISTVTTYGIRIISGVIGAFGWNEFALPLVLVVIYYAVLAASVAAGGVPRYWRAAIVATAVGILNLAVMLSAFYIECRPVGETAMDGFQGRYLVPLLPLAIFLGGEKENAPRKLNRLLFMVAILITTFSVLYLAQMFYPAFPGSRLYFRFSD
jgi:uncharacterized membrane protein